ncbi:MAG: hypothetical protein HFH60_02670 [Lachnospiraceae bacterium]|nr:hypothetical protein [Lachnospiraceae bacterium]
MERNENKNIKKISRNELVQFATNASSNLDASVINTVLDTVENTIFTMIKNTDRNEIVSIKLFDGLYIHSIYSPSERKKNNLTGEMIDTKSKIKVKPKVTRAYETRVNQ